MKSIRAKNRFLESIPFFSIKDTIPGFILLICMRLEYSGGGEGGGAGSNFIKLDTVTRTYTSCYCVILLI